MTRPIAPVLLTLVLVLPVGFGLLGVLLPSVGYLPWLGYRELSLDPWRSLWATPGLVRSLGLSLSTGMLAGVGALGIVALFFAAFHGTRAFALARRMLSPLLSVPHAAAAFGLAFLLAPSGWVMRVLSPAVTGFERPPDYLVVHDPLALTLAVGLIAKEIPFLALMAIAALPQIEFRRDLWIASSFGYGRMAAWLLVVFPQVYRQIRLPVFAVIAYGVSVVDMALILGPTTPPTLAVQLVRWINDADLSLRLQASAGAVLQLGVAGAAIALWRLLEMLTACLGRAALTRGLRLRSDWFPRGVAAVLMAAATAAIAVGLALLAVWSVAGPWRFPDPWPASLNLRVWTLHWPDLGSAVADTLTIAVPAVLLALVLVLAALEARERSAAPAAQGRAFLMGLYAPLLVPQVAFLFGLQIAFLKVGLDASLAALVLVHLVFVIPYVFFSLIEPWRAWDRRYALVAAALGHGPGVVFWRVRAPMLLRSILTAAAVGFAVSAGLYLPTLLIGGGRFATVTTEAVALSAGGNRRIIGAYALVQMVLPLAVFVLAGLLTMLRTRNRRGLWVGR